MKKPKVTLNISSLQDFVLNERNIEEILKHTYREKKITKKERTTNESTME